MFKVLGVEQPKMQGHGGAGRNKDKSSEAKLDNAQLITALNQTWSGFNNKIGRDYSTLTLNLPKKDDGKVELSFVDATPQHERARNQAVYNYKTANIERWSFMKIKSLIKKS